VKSLSNCEIFIQENLAEIESGIEIPSIPNGEIQTEAEVHAEMSLSEDTTEEKSSTPGVVPDERVVLGEENDDEVRRLASLFVDEIMQQAMQSNTIYIKYFVI